MATQQYFALDSLATGYAAAIADLASKTSTNRGYTVTQVVRSASHDSDIKIICAYVDESDLTGDTVNLHEDNFPNALCLDRYIDLQDRRERCFPMLGEMARSEFPTMTGVRYVSQAGKYAGVGDGTSAFDSFDGPQDSAINGGTNENHQLGYVYYYLGEIFEVSTASSNAFPTTGGQIDVEDATAGLPVQIRFDHPLLPCLMHAGATWDGNSSDLDWIVHSGSIYRRGDFGGFGRTIFQSALPQKGMDPTASAAELKADFLVKAANLASVGAGNFWHESMSPRSFDAVIRESSSAFTDYTTAAGQDTADDVIAFADGAANNDAVYFGDTDIFSTLIYVGTAGGTHTAVWEYWNGSAWASLADIYDASSTLKSSGSAVVLNLTRLAFNHPADWATTTINSQGPFYYIRLRKTAGTVTGNRTFTRFYAQDATLYVRRYDSAAVTRTNEPLLRWDGLGGYFWNLDTKGNYDLVRTRTLGPHRTSLNSCTDLRVKGGQWVLDDGSNSALFSGSSLEHTYEAATNGRLLYSVADRVDRDGTKVDATHPWVTDHLVAKHGSSLSSFTDMDDWFELVYVAEGLYCTSSGAMDLFNLDGCFVRNVGMVHTNSLGTVRDDSNGAVGDHHSLGIRGNGGSAAANWTWQRFCLLYAQSAINIYIPAEGGINNSNMDGPLTGSCSNISGLVAQDFIIAEHNGVTATGQGAAGIVLNGDNDTMLYDDGTGILSGNIFQRFVVANYDNDDSPDSPAISPHTGDGVIYQDFSALNCNWVWRNNRGGIQVVFSGVLQEDASGGPSYVDLASNVKTTGNVTSNFFPASEAVGDACYFGQKNYPFRRVALTIVAGAAGTYTLAFEYWDGDSWTAVSNLSDGTTNLTASGTISFDRPADWAKTTVNSAEFYWLRVRLASGSFTTDPTFNEARAFNLGIHYTLDDFYFEDPQVGIGWDRATDSGSNTTASIVDNFTGRLKSGQTIAGTDLFAYATTGAPHLTLAEYKAKTKSKTNTDALTDSTFAPNVSTTAGVDIEEVA